MKASDINYMDLELENICTIRELWCKNKDYHSDISEYFKTNYGELTFEGRFDSLVKNDSYKITIAYLDDKTAPIGYIISTLNSSKGEHLSFHVLDTYRGLGIGTRLLDSHMKWLKGMGCDGIKIQVSYENESTINFYKRNGFMPDTLNMYL